MIRDPDHAAIHLVDPDRPSTIRTHLRGSTHVVVPGHDRTRRLRSAPEHAAAAGRGSGTGNAAGGGGGGRVPPRLQSSSSIIVIQRAQLRQQTFPLEPSLASPHISYHLYYNIYIYIHINSHARSFPFVRSFNRSSDFVLARSMLSLTVVVLQRFPFPRSFLLSYSDINTTCTTSTCIICKKIL